MNRCSIHRLAPECMVRSDRGRLSRPTCKWRPGRKTSLQHGALLMRPHCSGAFRSPLRHGQDRGLQTEKTARHRTSFSVQLAPRFHNLSGRHAETRCPAHVSAMFQVNSVPLQRSIEILESTGLFAHPALFRGFQPAPASRHFDAFPVARVLRWTSFAAVQGEPV